MSEYDVLLLVLGVVLLELLSDDSQVLLMLSVSLGQLSFSAFIYKLSLRQDFQVKIQFFLVEFVHSLHVLHALLKDLHLILKSNLLLLMLISLLGPQLIQLLSPSAFCLSSVLNVGVFL